jgi:NitT/TauT family transport system ATP-binding protein
MPLAAAPSATEVILAGVSKHFGNGMVALDRLDLSIRGGEFLALLGPSGCGKSTALRLIAGLAEPSAGSISSNGQRLVRAADLRSCGIEVGFVFQEPTLMPWASVFRNVMLPLELRAVARDAAGKRVAAILEQVGLGAFRDAYPRELSGGMKMRVSVARALVTGPTLLLMDEPFAALDEITRFKLNDDLIALWRAAGPTIVFVTHSVFESVYLASRIVVMSPRPGRVFAEVSVDASYPRDENFRTSAGYAGFCRVVSDALARATAAGGGS